MKVAPVADVKARFSSYLRDSESGPIVVTRNGRPVAVLLSIKDEDELERLVLSYSPKFRYVLQAAKRQIREGKGIQHDEFWQEVEAES
jgi:prevent-host-death family protein